MADKGELVNLPSLAQSADSRIAHAHNDGKERIQVLKLPTAGEIYTEKREESYATTVQDTWEIRHMKGPLTVQLS